MRQASLRSAAATTSGRPRSLAQPARTAAAVPSNREGELAPKPAAENCSSSSSRREQLLSLAAFAAATTAAAASSLTSPPPAFAEGARPTNSLSTYEPMAGLEGKNYGKPRTVVEGYKQLPSGLQYADLVEAPSSSNSKALTAEPGDTVTVDWAGVTLGYYGRPFEARNKARGGSFTGDEKDFFRFTLGDGSVIPGFDEAVRGMQVGGVRRAVVPVELGYPDGEFNKVGPKPSNFSGKRALSFVLKNQGLIDKTLLFDVELLRVKKKE